MSERTNRRIPDLKAHLKETKKLTRQLERATGGRVLMSDKWVELYAHLIMANRALEDLIKVHENWKDG